jgi:hypothetical protein
MASNCGSCGSSSIADTPEDEAPGEVMTSGRQQELYSATRAASGVRARRRNAGRVGQCRCSNVEAACGAGDVRLTGASRVEAPCSRLICPYPSAPLGISKLP